MWINYVSEVFETSERECVNMFLINCLLLISVKILDLDDFELVTAYLLD